MRRLVLLLALAFPAFLSPAFGAELKIAEAVVTTAVVERAPVDAVQTFPGKVGKLYCFTHVTGAEEETSISHVWYFGDAEMARVTLPVRSSNWRTWSSKTFLPEWTGDWRVDVLNADGTLLVSVPFTLTRE